MALSQMQAVTGRKLRPNYVDAINIQSQYLPTLYAQKDDQAYRDKMYGLEEQSLGLDKEALAQRENELATWEALENEKLEEAKKQAKKANLLGVANLGLKAGLGLYGDKLLKPSPTRAADTPTVTDTGNIGKIMSEGSPTSWTGKATDWGKWGGAAKSVEPWAGGVAGGLASSLLTKKDDSTWKKAAIGVGAGALTSALTSGGDIYKSVIGGILGGIGGLFG